LGRKYKDWVAVFVFVSLLTYFTVWYLYLNPQHITLFLITTAVALSFVAIMAFLPKYRQRLVNKILVFHNKTQQKGAFYKHAMAFNAAMMAIVLGLSLVLTHNPELLSIPYVSYLFMIVLAVFLISAFMFIYSFFKTAGKWALVLLAIGATIAILRYLTKQ
jgi:hypothetical protein